MSKKKSIILITVCFLFSLFLSIVNAATTDEIINNVLKQFSIPKVTYESEVGDQSKVMQRSYTFNSTLKTANGDRYVVLTDMKSPDSIAALKRLAEVHRGALIQFDNFRKLTTDANYRMLLINTLKKNNPSYLAIAPQFKNYSENVVLALWSVLAELGKGSVNVYPGFLVAADESSFIHLIDNNIQVFEKNRSKSHRPIVIAQAVGAQLGGLRSVKKAEIIEALFKQLNDPANGLVIRDKSALPQTFPKAGNLGTFDVDQDGLLHQLPTSINNAISDSKLLLLFGHGMPGMSCSIDVQAFTNISLIDHLILCGSCFSATPVYSDFSEKPRVRQPFFLRAIESDAPMFYGHMRLNDGFPQLFVILESFLEGETLGQSYQRLINAMIIKTRMSPNQFIIDPDKLHDTKVINEHNDLLYIMIGDPAIHFSK